MTRTTSVLGFALVAFLAGSLGYLAGGGGRVGGPAAPPGFGGAPPSFAEIVERFEKYNLRALMVVDEFSRLVGLISIEDVFSHLVEEE